MLRLLILILVLLAMAVHGQDLQSKSDPTDNASERIPTSTQTGKTFGNKDGEFRWTPGYGDAAYAVYDLTMRVVRRARKVKEKSGIEKKIDSWMTTH